MKPLLTVLALVLTATTVAAQDVSRLFTRPALPPREVLDRLNLILAWYAYVPTESRRDLLYSVQLTGEEMLVQTRSGSIVSLDPETGRIRWGPVLAGLPYQPQHALGYNSRLVLVANGTMLYALDRRSGRQVWSIDLPGAPIAPVVADEEQLYASLSSGRLRVYRIASAQPGTAKGAPPEQRVVLSIPGMVDIHGLPPPSVSVTGPFGSREYTSVLPSGPQPISMLFEYVAANTVEMAPLLSPEVMVLPGSLGNLIGMSKYRKLELFTLKTGSAITAPPGQHGEFAYAPSSDRDLYTVNMVTGKILWRFTSPLPVYDRPAVTDADLYVSPSGAGLYRLDRPSGELLWHSPEAQHFLASNPKFVYAADRSGRLLVLDGRRGTALSGYDSHDFVVPVSNETTDRVYLAANNGLIVCLHDRDYAAPVRTKYALLQPPGPAKKPAAKPPAEAPKGGEGEEKPR